MKRVISSLLLTAFLAVSGSAWALSQIDGVYQIGTAEDLKAFAELVNGGEAYANAVLTADIDYTTDAVQIGNPKYAGVFDGQGHKVTVDFKGTSTKGVDASLFYKVLGIVKNLWVSGSLSSPLDNVASIAFNLYGWIDHCYSDATISCTKIGSSSCGGIVGVCYTGASISNSFFGGKFTSETATNFSGIMGWSDGTNTVAHCLVVAECEGTACNGEDGDGYMFARNCSRVDNNYCLYNAEANLKANAFRSDRQFVGNFTTTAAELADGTIAYKLGWGQEIGVDAMPSPFSTKTVYPVGDCSAPTEYTNDAAQSAHVYSGYKCSVCGAYTPDFMTPVDGVYQIGTPEQLCWFALYVNARHSDADAVLTADIDMSGVTNYPMIGTHGEQTGYYSMYRGTFDGQGHKISNLTVDMPNFWNVGLFGSVAAPAVVKNIFTDETCSFSGKKNIGGIMGQTYGVGAGGIVTLQNLGSAAKMKSNGASDAGVAGIVGKCAGGVKGVITNCWFEGEITGTSLGYISGWCGSNQFTLNNCWSISQSEGVNGLARAGSSTAIKLNNCFTLKGTMGTAITEEDIASGALCYGLNKGLDAPVWFQTIGTDAKPTLTGSDIVYKNGTLFCDGSNNEVTYANTETGLTLGDHVGFTDDVCTKCGIGLVDGVYQLSKPAHLTWFANYVNKGNGATGAKVTANIDMKDIDWAGMTAYTGTFDGGENKISNLEGPLFVLTGDGVTIKNLTLEGAITRDGGNNFGAFIADHQGKYLTLTNCVNKTAVTAETVANVGGFIGRIHGDGAVDGEQHSVITDCVNSAKVSGKSSVGGFVGMCGCNNSAAEVTFSNSSNNAQGLVFAKSGDAGGFVGTSWSWGNVFNQCFNIAPITNEGSNTAGIIGTAMGGSGASTKNLKMYDCYNAGDVTSKSGCAAGLLGATGNKGTQVVERCFNAGTIRTEGECAGVLGGARGAQLTDCFNLGDIYPGAGQGVGSIVCWCWKNVSSITNSWNIGEIKDMSGATAQVIFRAATPSGVKVTNSYDLTNGGAYDAATLIDGFDAAWANSGAFTYYINDKAGKQVYYQTIGTDAHPVLDATHGIVNQITAAGYATQYIADTDVTIPAGVKAYTGKVNGDYLTLTEVTEKIPAAAAVVLEGAEGYYSFVPTTGAAAVAENDLKGTATALTADGSQYVLAKKDDVVGFYQATEGTIAAGKAYLTGIAAGVKVVTFGTATSLTPALSEEREAVIYDLSGRRVEKATKGIYIINGKKVLK